MAVYQASDLRKGLKILIDGQPYIVTDFTFTKPGKGQALYRCRIKNMLTNRADEKVYRSVDTFESANLMERKMQFLYNQEDEYVFMDNNNYEQVSLTKEQVGDAKNYLIDNMEVSILFFDLTPLDITLPNFVELKVTKADPWVKGDSAASDSKPVTLETGYTLRVPPFVEEGTKISVDTRTGAYLTRVK
jgi:elongation factor P